ncbi:MAG: SCO family protein [Halioglobus sp.]|nr:SCO family protein [Halioglobus sp.]
MAAIPSLAQHKHAEHEHGGHSAQAPENHPAAAGQFDFEAPEPGTYELPVIKPAPDGAVLDTAGKTRRLHELMAGRIVLLSFVYLSCTDVCPVATAKLHSIRALSAREPDLRDNLEFVTVSFDPERDTPEALADYARVFTENNRGAPWHFLTTRSQEQVNRILDAYGQPVRRRPPDADGRADIAHLLRVYLIDREGRIRNIYGLGFLDTRLLLADVRTLLLEERRAEHD